LEKPAVEMIYFHKLDLTVSNGLFNHLLLGDVQNLGPKHLKINALCTLTDVFKYTSLKNAKYD